MSVLDLRGSAGGDAVGLAALAAALHAAASAAERAAAAAGGLEVDEAFAPDSRALGSALRTAAAVVSEAAEQLRSLPVGRGAGSHAAADAVEATLAERLREPLGTLAGALTAR